MKYTIALVIFILEISRVISQNPDYTGYENRNVRVISTAAENEYRLTLTDTLVLATFGQPFENEPCIFVDPAHTFQAFMGIGAALTDAAAETFNKLPEDQQELFLNLYFSDENGIGYSMARTNIHSCDFSSGSYTYVEEGDKLLESFSIDHDKKYRIPFIRKAIGAAGGSLRLFASPWSPPAWMKDNQDMLHGGKLLPEFYEVWAEYFIRFIDSYEQEGIPVWGITVQNEPMAIQTWESCIYTADEERDFIKNFLGPKLRAKGYAEKKLIAWDHNRDLMYHRANRILSDPEAAQYVWGIGFHWYESWTGAPTPQNVKLVAEAFPDKALLLTEACNYPFSWDTFEQWHWGENYGSSMISDFNNGAVAWIDWNILLDETGGPNHVGNFCFAPVHADTRNGSLHIMNSYYYIGHFSKFIRPGAKRIACSSNRAQLLTTAFLNPDGSVAVIVMNPQDTALSYRMYLGNLAVETLSLPHSIVTLLF